VSTKTDTELCNKCHKEPRTRKGWCRKCSTDYMTKCREAKRKAAAFGPTARSAYIVEKVEAKGCYLVLRTYLDGQQVKEAPFHG
jgi:hypothetical protein